jgi:hypothetical protein
VARRELVTDGVDARVSLGCRCVECRAAQPSSPVAKPAEVRLSSVARSPPPPSCTEEKSSDGSGSPFQARAPRALFHVRKNPRWARRSSVPVLTRAPGHAWLSSTSGAPARPPEEGKAMGARLVGRSCAFGTDASLKCGVAVIKTGGVALAFG